MRTAQDQGRNVEVEEEYGISVGAQYMKVETLRKKMHGIVRELGPSERRAAQLAMARREREVLEHAVHTIAEQAAKGR
jgi:hypothetical protein